MLKLLVKISCALPHHYRTGDRFNIMYHIIVVPHYHGKGMGRSDNVILF